MDLIDYRLSDVDFNGHKIIGNFEREALMVAVGQEGVYKLIESCNLCKEWLSFEVIDGNHVVTTSCTVVNEPYRVTVEFPSGTVIGSDTLDDVLSLYADADISSMNGRKAYAEKCAANDIAQGTVMNTNPFVYVVGDTIIIGNPAWNDTDDDESVPAHPAEWGNPVGQIHTEVWAYSLSDEAGLIARTNGNEEKLALLRLAEKEDNLIRFTVNPGKYEFTHHAHVAGFDFHANQPTVYATGVRIPE